MTEPSGGMRHQQSAFLRALAGHLDSHPSLCRVTVRESWRGRPELGLPYGAAESDIHGWAASVGAHAVVVVAGGGDNRQTHLRAVGQVGSHAVDVVGVIDGMAERVGPGDQLPVDGGAS